VAIGDTDLIIVRFGPLCGLKLDISRGPRSARTGREQLHSNECTEGRLLLDHFVGAAALAARRGQRLAVLRLISVPFEACFFPPWTAEQRDELAS